MTNDDMIAEAMMRDVQHMGIHEPEGDSAELLDASVIDADRDRKLVTIVWRQVTGERDWRPEGMVTTRFAVYLFRADVPPQGMMSGIVGTP